MKSIVNVILALMDLIEAELDRVEEAVVKTSISVGLVLSSCVFLSVGIGLILYAGFAALAEIFHTSIAAAITGAAALLTAAILLRMGVKRSER